MADLRKNIEDVLHMVANLVKSEAEPAAEGILDAYRKGLRTAHDVIENAMKRTVPDEPKPEGTLADRVHIVAMNLMGWATQGAPDDLPMDAVDAYRYGLTRALNRLEEALKDRPMPLTGDGGVAQVVSTKPEAHPLDRFRELAKLWRDIQVGRLNAAAGDLTGIRYALDQCSDQLVAVLEGTPVEATFWSGAIPASRFEPKPIPSPMWSFRPHGMVEPRVVDVRDIVSVVRAMVPIDGAVAKRWASVIHLRNGGNFIVAEHPVELVPQLVKSRLACGCTTPLMGDLCADVQDTELDKQLREEAKRQREHPLQILPEPKPAPLFTKCEQLIYDVARQVLSEPSLFTRAQMTQNIDYWLYQLQTCNLARPKPEPLPVSAGSTAG